MQEIVRRLITVQIENESDVAQDFSLFQATVSRTAPNYGNPPAIKITCPNFQANYLRLLTDTQTIKGGIYIVDIFSDVKGKFAFYEYKCTSGKNRKTKAVNKLLGKITSHPLMSDGVGKGFLVHGDVYIKPDGWKLQPREKLLIDFEVEFTDSVQEVLVKPTAFIKICIENKSNKPQKYTLFNANLNCPKYRLLDGEDFGSTSDIAIRWESNKEYYWSKEFNGVKDKRQKYGHLLSEIKHNGFELRVVNIFSPKRDYFLFKSSLMGGHNFFYNTKLALPYPLAYQDRKVLVVGGNTELSPCNLELAPYEKTWIELEVEQD